MSAKRYAVLADIESVRVPYASFDKALKELSKYGEISTCKFYGFSSRRTKDYREFIETNYYEALGVLPKKRSGRLDLRQVIDAVNLASIANVNGFFLMFGHGNLQPLISWLKAAGFEVIAGVVQEDDNSSLCNKVILLDQNKPFVETTNAGGYKQVDPEAQEVKKRRPIISDDDEIDYDAIKGLEDIIKRNE